MTAVRVTGPGLEAFTTALLVRKGVPPDAAAIGAGVLVRTDLRGIRSHGVRHLPTYVRQMKGGGIAAHPDIRPVTQGPTTATLDAGAAMGHIAAERGTRLAIQKARAAGMALVTVRNSNHCGALGHYALLCAEAGLIGISVSNAPPIMAVTGARGRVLGNGPTAYAAPNPGGDPIVFDAAMSVVAGGRIRMAAERGERIPEGWVLDLDGRPSTDPEDFARGGALVPAAGHKGYGLTLFGELLAGVLSGAAMAAQIGVHAKPDTPTNTGHAIMAVDVAAFQPPDVYAARVGELAAMVKSAPPAEGVKEVLLPGELEAREERRARAEGFALDEVIWADLSRLAADHALVDQLEAAKK
jgi:LDH2 family malate/lactate/ureidoglycolate dehydrogenase